MSRDEKKSRKDESLPAGGSERSAQDFSLSAKRSEGKADSIKDGPGDPLPFPDLKPYGTASRLDMSFGMPEFEFPLDRQAGQENGSQEITKDKSADPALPETAAGSSPPLVFPLKEDTGWQSGASIAKPSSLRARIEMQDAEDGFANGLYADDDDLPEEPASETAKTEIRKDANITPFPGTIFQRQDEAVSPDPLSRSLGASAALQDLSLSAENESEAPASGSQDTLADAVQSALRNIYGGQGDQLDEGGELESYVVADALAGPDPTPGRTTWPEENGPGDWAAQAASSAEAAQESSAQQNTEAVLDFLYSQRQQERTAAFTTREPTLGDYAPQASNDEWNENADLDDSGRVTPFPARDYRGRNGEAERAVIRGASSGYYEEEPVRPALEDRWGQPTYAVPQNTRGAITPTYAPSLPAAPDQMQGQGPDSGHLLGAAGLGLIGGIALAGVLAVFVFNSFVDEGAQNAGDPGAKVVERLAPPQTTSTPAEIVRPAPDIRPVQAAATAPQAAPAVEPPAAAVPAAPQRSAALSPAEPAITGDAGKLRLITQAVSGAPDSPIRLNIGLSDADVGDALVSLKGLPKDARLSTGIDVGGGQWLLPPNRLKDLTVTAPASAAGNHQLEVQLLKDDAQTSLSDPAPFNLIIAPAGSGARQIAPTQPTPGAAPSPAGRPDVSRLAALPDEAPAPDTDFLTQMLIRDGNKKMREGDIAAARRYYEQATLSGNPEAALAMGRSFDPTYFEKLNVKTGKPDPAVAFDWYKKALDGGLVTARVKIDALKQWLQR